MKIKVLGLALLLGAGSLLPAAPPRAAHHQTFQGDSEWQDGDGGWHTWGGAYGNYGNGDYWGGWDWLLPPIL